MAWVAATIAIGVFGPARAIDIVREPVSPPVGTTPPVPVAPSAAVPAPAPPSAPTVRPVPAPSPATPAAKVAAPKAGSAATSAKSEAKPEAKSEPRPASLVAQAPRFVVGDTWQFVRTPTDGADRKVIEFRTTLAAVSDRELTTVTGYRMTPTMASLNQTQNNRQNRLFRPHGLSVQFPLAVGKVWNEEYEFMVADTEPRAISRIKAKARVLRRETVTVPAGTFDTLVVQHTLDIEVMKGGRETATRTVWYSPEARAFVRHQYEKRDAKSAAMLEAFTIEMKSYSVAR